jgi:MerR family transcriptional regulator, light-induced transcriptional regulator
MNGFTIRDIENLCGIKAHTLRIWEQRYRLISPRRGAGNHRSYDHEDLKYLLRIAFLYHNGYKISQLARMDGDEITRLAMRVPLPARGNEVLINHLVDASLDFDQAAFERVLHNAELLMGFEKAVTQVVYPFLIKIGVLWLTGNVVPAQEHFASALITRRLMSAINSLEIPPVPGPGYPVILLYTPEDEFHELPLLYSRYLMRKSGLTTVYFGADTPIGTIVYYCERRPVTHLYFHLVTNLLHCEPAQYVKRLRSAFPGKSIVISGNAVQSIGECPDGVQLIRSLEEMERFARQRPAEFGG